MGKTKMVLCSLLAVVLIFPLAFAIAPAVQADPEEPQEGAGAGLIYDDPPDLVGSYLMTGKITVYDWTGNKYSWTMTGCLKCFCQDGHKVSLFWTPLVAPAGGPGMSLESAGLTLGLMPPSMEPSLAPCDYPYNGFVGSKQKNNSGKFKGKPRLSETHWYGTVWGEYPWGTSTLNAEIKLDKTGAVKSIKGEILGWEEWGDTFSDGSAMWSQYKYKFTATPGSCSLTWE